MTRRFFAQLFIGITLALPIRFEHKTIHPTSDPMVECGPVSPLRKGYPEWDQNAFALQMITEVWKHSL